MANMNGQYQLTNVEAQRICAVLDELMVDLRLAFSVTPQTLSDANDIAGLVGQENERFFVMQRELEKQFCVLASQLEGPVSEFVADAEQHDAQDAIVHDFFDVARRYTLFPCAVLTCLSWHAYVRLCGKSAMFWKY